MEDEEATAEATEAPEVAEVAAVEPEVADVAAVEPEPEPEVAEVAAVEPEPEIGVDDFTWDGWDGSLEDIPDGQRGWIEKALEWSASQQAERDVEIERLRETYSAWMDGVEDPRLAELQAKVESGTAEKGEMKLAYDVLKTEYDEYVAGYEAYIEQVNVAKAEEFKAENPSLFDSGPNEAAAGELYDEGWPMRFLPIVMALKPSQRKAAKEKFGARPDLPHADRDDRASLVLEAVAGASEKPSRTNSSTALVAGTETTTSQSPRVEAETGGSGSLNELKLAAVRRNLKRARGT